MFQKLLSILLLLTVCVMAQRSWPDRGTTADRPSNPRAGYHYFNTTDSLVQWYDGVRWRGYMDSTSTVAQDTAALKLLGGVNTAYLKQLSSGNANGGGWFVYLDSAYAKDAYNYFNAGSAKQWARVSDIRYPTWFDGTKTNIRASKKVVIGDATTETDNATWLQAGSINAGNGLPINDGNTSFGVRMFFKIPVDSTAINYGLAQESRLIVQRNSGTPSEFNGISGIVYLDSAFGATRTAGVLGVSNNSSGGDITDATLTFAGVQGQTENPVSGSKMAVSTGLWGRKSQLNGVGTAPTHDYAIISDGYIGISANASTTSLTSGGGITFRSDKTNSDNRQFQIRRTAVTDGSAGQGALVFTEDSLDVDVLTLQQGGGVSMPHWLFISRSGGSAFGANTLLQTRAVGANETSVVFANTNNIRGVDIGFDASSDAGLNVRNSAGTVRARLDSDGSAGSYILGPLGLGTASTVSGADVQVNGDLKVTDSLDVTTVIAKGGAAYTHPDYVFQDDYELMDLDQLREYVREHKHLPGIQTAEDVKKNGVDLLQSSGKLLEKLEEAYLHILQLEERIKRLENAGTN